MRWRRSRAEIQIETNTACNATCVMCPYPEVSKEMKPGRMDAPLYEKILGECATEPTVWRLEPFLNNEPFTDVRMVDWIAMAKARVPHAIVTVTTNGSLVTPKITDRLIHSGLDAIWFSFNGATKETYEQIMGLSFDQVKKNIDYLLDKRPASLRVYTNMIDTVPMRGEIAENVRYWQSRGVQSGVVAVRQSRRQRQQLRRAELPRPQRAARAPLRAPLSQDVHRLQRRRVVVLHGLAAARGARQRAGAEPARDLAGRSVSALPAVARRGARERAGAVLDVFVCPRIATRSGGSP